MMMKYIQYRLAKRKHLKKPRLKFEEVKKYIVNYFKANQNVELYVHPNGKFIKLTSRCPRNHHCNGNCVEIYSKGLILYRDQTTFTHCFKPMFTTQPVTRDNFHQLLLRLEEIVAKKTTGFAFEKGDVVISTRLEGKFTVLVNTPVNELFTIIDYNGQRTHVLTGTLIKDYDHDYDSPVYSASTKEENDDQQQ